jgi:hypothetical protein
MKTSSDILSSSLLALDERERGGGRKALVPLLSETQSYWGASAFLRAFARLLRALAIHPLLPPLTLWAADFDQNDLKWSYVFETGQLGLPPHLVLGFTSSTFPWFQFLLRSLHKMAFGNPALWYCVTAPFRDWPAAAVGLDAQNVHSPNPLPLSLILLSMITRAQANCKCLLHSLWPECDLIFHDWDLSVCICVVLVFLFDI